MKRKFFSGNTLEQALISAANHFGIDPEQVAYRKREKKQGLLKASRRVVIEVDADAPERPPEIETAKAPPGPAAAALAEGPGEEDRVMAVEDDFDERDAGEDEAYGDEEYEDEEDAGKEGVADEDEEDEEYDRYVDEEDFEDEEGEYEDEEDEYEIEEEEPTPARPSRGRLSATASVERATREVLRFLKIEADISVERRKDHFEIDLSSDDHETLVGDEGKVLQAMEYLIPRIARNWMNKGVPVKVDCEGFRAAHEQELTDLAYRVADEVREDGVEQALDPMHPADRRLIHLALADDPDVETESEGRGYFKRVRIIPIDLDDSRA